MKTTIFKISRDRLRAPAVHGFTLVEMLVSAGILTLMMVSVLRTFFYYSDLVDMSQALTLATAQAQSKLDEIRNSSYSLITTDYALGGTPGNTFNLSQMTGQGVIFIDASNTNLLQVETTVSFRLKNGRVVGEDTNLNGVLNVGEDFNGNGKLDSVVNLITLMARR